MALQIALDELDELEQRDDLQEEVFHAYNPVQQRDHTDLLLEQLDKAGILWTDDGKISKEAIQIAPAYMEGAFYRLRKNVSSKKSHKGIRNRNFLAKLDERGTEFVANFTAGLQPGIDTALVAFEHNQDVAKQQFIQQQQAGAHAQIKAMQDRVGAYRSHAVLGLNATEGSQARKFLCDLGGKTARMDYSRDLAAYLSNN